MNILLFADLHCANIYNFNVRQTNYKTAEYSRVDELYSTLGWISDVAAHSDTMMAMNLGDTFHQALRFYVERYNYVIKALNDITVNTMSKAMIVLEGNHDRNEETSAVDTVENINGVTLVKNSIKVKFVSEINSHFIFVPYIRDPEKLKAAFKTLSDKFSGSKTKTYVFCHIDIKEAYEGLISSSYQLSQFNSYDDLNLGIYTGVFSGHIHFKKNIRNNFHYIGAVLNHNFSDSADRKGLTMLHLSPNGCEIEFKENPYCPLFFKLNLEKVESLERKMTRIESEKAKYPFTNIYTTIYSLNSDDGKKKLGEFLDKNKDLFTDFETRGLDSEEELNAMEVMTSSIDKINVFDLIIDKGIELLRSKNKSEEQIEKYVMRLKTVCQLS